jgi:YbgC/YbaW family acyl-CoA thioester hydrolase
MERESPDKELESKTRIRFPDCDPFNHLNNSRYIDYMINAREDQLIKHYNLDIYKMARETGVSWVVSQTQIAYLSSAELMEIVTIQTKLVSYSDKNLLVEAIMWDENKTQMKALMWIKFAHFSLRTRKSLQHSEELMQLFSDVKYPLKEVNFEDRVTTLKTEYLKK